MSDAVTRTDEAEEWRPVVGFEGLYEVSDQGRVRSLGRNTTSGRVLRPWSHNSYGHLAVGLSKHGRVTRRYVHFLVAAAFVGPRPAGLEVRHGNGNGTDNRACNLSYSTHAENMGDTVAHGTSHAAMTHCKRGHVLAAPNVAAYIARQGGRTCRACSLASGYVWREARKGRALDVTEVADQRYRWIMGDDPS